MNTPFHKGFPVDGYVPLAMVRCALVSLFLLGWCSSCRSQGLGPSIHGSWGSNLLTSPGADLLSSPGRTGSIGASLTIGSGWEKKLRIQPTVSYSASAYRTRMAYRAFFVSVRNSIQVDLLVAFPQMNGATLLVGPFIGSILRSNAYFQQGDQNSAFQAQVAARALAQHFPLKNEAGLVLGYSFPFQEGGRLGMDLQLRQHLLPLVEQDQFFALQFSPDQQVLSTTTRATILSVGFHYRFI